MHQMIGESLRAREQVSLRFLKKFALPHFKREKVTTVVVGLSYGQEEAVPDPGVDHQQPRFGYQVREVPAWNYADSEVSSQWGGEIGDLREQRGSNSKVGD
jgi:hypothetical protein